MRSRDGDTDLRFWAAGQEVGLINEIISCGDLARKIMDEAERAQQKIRRLE